MHMVMSWLILSVTALWTQAQTCKRHISSKKRLANKDTKRNVTYRAAAASWFLRLGELGSVDRALAASSSLLDDMEIVFRFDTTCVWSSLDWTRGGRRNFTTAVYKNWLR